MNKGKKKSVFRTILKILGIAFGVGLVACTIAYFVNPEFNTLINNSWTDFWYQIKK